VKKQASLMFLICLLLATAGCRQKPAKAIVLIPSADDESPSVYAEEGGILEFRRDDGAAGTFKVTFSAPVCEPTDKLTGTSTEPVTCHVIAKSGDYDVTIAESTGHPNPPPPKQVKAYIRPCKGC
jgi:hypothetical protein